MKTATAATMYGAYCISGLLVSTAMMICMPSTTRGCPPTPQFPGCEFVDSSIADGGVDFEIIIAGLVSLSPEFNDSSLHPTTQSNHEIRSAQRPRPEDAARNKGAEAVPVPSSRQAFPPSFAVFREEGQSSHQFRCLAVLLRLPP